MFGTVLHGTLTFFFYELFQIHLIGLLMFTSVKITYEQSRTQGVFVQDPTPKHVFTKQSFTRDLFNHPYTLLPYDFPFFLFSHYSSFYDIVLVKLGGLFILTLSPVQTLLLLSFQVISSLYFIFDTKEQSYQTKV